MLALAGTAGAGAGQTWFTRRHASIVVAGEVVKQKRRLVPYRLIDRYPVLEATHLPPLVGSRVDLLGRSSFLSTTTPVPSPRRAFGFRRCECGHPSA